ncbi:hypothetical protein IE81DRAFT_324477 [Ceraceosorus guamensis]|uniref:Leo1-domain-containing protein n=1 Tax=Ceraceosorus guamensis TaxID=1522189 RepID=A0A316VV41_9BASI|nr:hypothetical protein IE81DRAFT_324477 [Ceraceosorus guamensis]PWN41487.1 hypothetical protein IE81DRAFT_324477 [Ceraceosorus guamensis]
MEVDATADPALADNLEADPAAREALSSEASSAGTEAPPEVRAAANSLLPDDQDSPLHQSGTSSSAHPIRDGEGATSAEKEEELPVELAQPRSDDEEQQAEKPQGEQEDADDDDDDGDLFGDDDEDVEDVGAEQADKAVAVGDTDDDDDAMIRQTGRRRKAAASPSSARSNSFISKDDEEAAASKRRLEHLEDDAPMGIGMTQEDAEAQAEAEMEQHADFSLPSLPVRRGAPHWITKLPNFVGFQTTPFDTKTFDMSSDEAEIMRTREQIARIQDPGLRATVASTCTMRWRWAPEKEINESGKRLRQSNTRVVRWSDGTLSFQLGDELYDITQIPEPGTREAPRGANAQSRPQAEGPSAQASQRGTDGSAARYSASSAPSTYLFVHHSDDIEASEGPIAGSMVLRPTDTQSETHRRLARAVKHSRGARVTQMAFDTRAKDPEEEKAALEKQKRLESLKAAKKRRQNAGLSGLGAADEEFWDSRAGRRRLGRAGADYDQGATYASDEEEEAALSGDVEGDDGFIVSDKGSPSSEKSAQDDMDVDDEPDDLERAEKSIEDAALRKAEADAQQLAASTQNGETAGDVAKERSRRRVVADSEDEEE